MRISHILCYGCSCDYVPAKPAGYKEVGLRNELPRSSDLAHATGRKQAKPAYTALQEQGCWGVVSHTFGKTIAGTKSFIISNPIGAQPPIVRALRAINPKPLELACSSRVFACARAATGSFLASTWQNARRASNS